jgi:hypothetical protein
MEGRRPDEARPSLQAAEVAALKAILAATRLSYAPANPRIAPSRQTPAPHAEPARQRGQ